VSKENREGSRRSRRRPIGSSGSRGNYRRIRLKTLDELYRSLNPADLKRRIDQKLKKLYALYEKKRKGSVRVNPYKELDPSSVSFLVMQ
jgi:hypothetical protein